MKNSKTLPFQQSLVHSGSLFCPSADRCSLFSVCRYPLLPAKCLQTVDQRSIVPFYRYDGDCSGLQETRLAALSWAKPVYALRQASTWLPLSLALVFWTARSQQPRCLCRWAHLSPVWQRGCRLASAIAHQISPSWSQPSSWEFQIHGLVGDRSPWCGTFWGSTEGVFLF